MTPEARREYQRQWRANNPDKVKASAKRWREENIDRHRATNRKWREENKDRHNEMIARWQEENRDRIRTMNREARLKRVYGMTATDFDRLFESQGKACAICRTTEPRSSRGWHVDHCHASRAVRGVLCNSCNLMLGYAMDRVDTLHAAVRYLEGAR